MASLTKSMIINENEQSIIIEDIDHENEISIEISDLDHVQSTMWIKADKLEVLKNHIDYLYNKYKQSLNK